MYAKKSTIIISFLAMISRFALRSSPNEAEIFRSDAFAQHLSFSLASAISIRQLSIHRTTIGILCRLLFNLE